MKFLNCRNLNSTINTKIISYHIIFTMYLLKIIQVPIVMQQEYSIVSININPTFSMQKDVIDMISLGLLRTHQ